MGLSHRGTFFGVFGIKGLRGRVRGILTVGGMFKRHTLESEYEPMTGSNRPSKKLHRSQKLFDFRDNILKLSTKFVCERVFNAEDHFKSLAELWEGYLYLGTFFLRP